ncbi:MAG: NAD+ synthase, partial [Alphaproteobacteria bacterium]|nr:NAD+ synthase [Alphaproteobacteria bacterium]
MTSTLLFALAQLNPTVGDIAGNTRKLIEARDKAAAQGADIVLAPETYLSGYQIDDLVQVEGILPRIDEAIAQLTEATSDGGPAVIVGAPRRDGEVIRNSVFVLDGGDVAAIRDKVRLPGTSVFDEPRNFTPGAMSGPVMLRGALIGLPICEDMWHQDVVECIDESGAEFFISCNGSPYVEDKTDDRMMATIARVTETGKPLIYLNLVGGQDVVVYDGASVDVSAGGQIGAYLASFTETVALVEGKKTNEGWRFQGAVIKPDTGNTTLSR